jgi:DNA-binding transcriptional LysR family regulator
VAPDLASGRLVELFGGRLPSASCYHAVYRPEQRGQDKVVKFVAWLLETFGK